MTETRPAVGTDHAGLEVLTVAQCDELLSTAQIGRIAFVSDGDVLIFPVTYRYVDGAIVFRSAEGTKLDAAANHRPVAFEIDGFDVEARTGWSVLVTGIAHYIIDEQEEAELADVELTPWTPELRARRWIRISPDEITGRKII